MTINEGRAMNPERPFWDRHEWWEHQHRTREISLVALVRLWAQRADLSDLDHVHATMFARELQSWCTTLGGCGWVRNQIGPLAAMLATTGVRNPHDLPAEWTRVSELLGQYGDPLSRFTLSFVGLAHTRLPIVPSSVSSPFRECARSVASDVRVALVDATRPGGSVLASRETAEEFTATADGHRDAYRSVAMRAYARRLLQKADEIRDDKEIAADVKIAVTEAVEAAVEELDMEFDGCSAAELGVTPSAEILARREQAKPIIFAAAQAMPKSKWEKDGFDEALRRAINAIGQTLESGNPIPDARIVIEGKLRDIHIERMRSESKKKEELPLGPEDLVKAVNDSRDEVEAFRRQEQHIEQKLLMEDMRKHLRSIEINAHRRGDLADTRLSEFWEKTLALSILAGEIPLDRPGWDKVREKVRKVVVERWTAQSGRPTDAVCTNRVLATTLVLGLITIALARAVPDSADFADLIGSDTQTSADRITVIDAALGIHRTNTTPQDLYDQLHQNGGRK